MNTAMSPASAKSTSVTRYVALAIRSSPRLAKLPVVLLTSRESDGDRARGLAAGADAYLVKSAFDQANLLETISQLL